MGEGEGRGIAGNLDCSFDIIRERATKGASVAVAVMPKFRLPQTSADQGLGAAMVI